MPALDARLQISTADRNGRGAPLWRASLGGSPLSSAAGVDVARSAIRPVVRDHARRRGRGRDDRPEDDLSGDSGGAGRRTDAYRRVRECPTYGWAVLSTGAGRHATAVLPKIGSEKGDSRDVSSRRALYDRRRAR